jgi:hypothetical protein
MGGLSSIFDIRLITANRNENYNVQQWPDDFSIVDNDDFQLTNGFANFDGIDDDLRIANTPFAIDHLSGVRMSSGFTLNATALRLNEGVEFPIFYKPGEYLFGINAANKLYGYVYDAEGDYIGMVMDSALVGTNNFVGCQMTFDGTSTITLKASWAENSVLIASSADNSGVFGGMNEGGSDPFYTGRSSGDWAPGYIIGAVVINKHFENYLSSPLAITMRNLLLYHSTSFNSQINFGGGFYQFVLNHIQLTGGAGILQNIASWKYLQSNFHDYTWSSAGGQINNNQLSIEG